MTFRAVYPAATKFKYVAQTIAKITDEIPFVATPEGLFVKTLSSDKTTMIVLQIPSTAFEEYLCEEDKVTFIVSADEFSKVSKRGTRNDVIELVLEKEHRRLRFTFQDRKTGVERTFYVELREGIVEELPEPSLELPVIARMLTDTFKNALRDVKLVGEEVEIIAEGEERIIFQSISPQREYYNIMEREKALLSFRNTSEKVHAKYSLELLEAALKATTAAEAVTLEMGENMPLKLTFDLPGGATLVYWIAPRI